MRLKKMRFYQLLLFSFIITISMVGCSAQETTTSTSSYILVKEKGYSEDYTKAWIIVNNPNDTETKEIFKIIVEQPMVWNLIEVNKTYFSSYVSKGENDRVLIQISNIGDDESLR